MKELRSKLLEYKERLKAEEQKNAQSNNDFGFDEDESTTMGRLQLENESLLKQNKLLEAKDQEKKEELDKLQQEYMRLKRATEGSSKEVTEANAKLAELKNAYLKLEVLNETLKKGGDGAQMDKFSATTVKRFEELERKYVQAKR
jgi:chromosome segregation ATPase